MGDERDRPSGVDLADGVTEPADTATTDAPLAQRRGWRQRSLVLLPWILVVLAIALAVASTWRWQELAALERTREDVAAVSSQFVTTLTTWDATDGMTETRDELRAAGTDDFARDVDELFGTTEDLRGLAELGARSEGEVREVYVQSLRGDHAEALAVVIQQTTTDTVEIPEVHLRYASLVLQRVDGTWLIDDLELLIDTTPGSETVAPGEIEDGQQEGEG